MNTLHPMALIASWSLLLVACGVSETGVSGSGNGDAWWNVATDEPWSGGAPSEGEGEGEFEDDEGEDEAWRALFGEFELANGQPTGGIIGYYWNRGGDDVVCDFEFPAEVTGTADCADCTWAVSLSMGQLEGSVDGDCSPYDSWANGTLEIAVRDGVPGTKGPGDADWTFAGVTEPEADFLFFEREVE